MNTDTTNRTEVHTGTPSATPSTTRSQSGPGPVAVAPAAPAGPPSVHVRAVITWLAIFPLVAIGMMLIAPFAESWHPVLRAFALTLVVVPLAVYLVVPQLMRGYGTLRRRAPRSGESA
jgi:antibiotic biosynthesis monooxygenase (ABM) superfamily enzyme